MKYLILGLFLGIMVGVVLWLKKGSKKIQIGYQEKFYLNPEEQVLREWKVYLSPQDKQTEGKPIDFLEGGKLFTLLQTDQNRLALLDESQATFIFDQTYPPVFAETKKKSNLSLFARVAQTRVLDLKIPGYPENFEIHVPLEAVSFLVSNSED